PPRGRPKFPASGGPPRKRPHSPARLDTLDWQLLIKAKSDGIMLLLPDVQQLRMLAAALKVRFRGEVAEKAFDEAFVTAKTMFALSRHCGEHPTLIGDLVGIAIAFVAIGPLDEMIQQPGCPNLYWALTALPSPFIDLRKGLQGETLWLLNISELIDEKAPMGNERLETVVEKIDQTMQLLREEDKPKGASR